MTSNYSDATDFVLESTQRSAVLDAVAATLNQYVFPDVAEQLQADIQQRRTDQGYAEITGGE